jgi:carbonic anhydrase
MAADLIANGITNVIPTSTLENNECQEPKNWNWVDQENWPCTCATGSDQSPLIINESEAIEKISMRLQFRYIAMDGITATYNGHEVELLGDFGMLNFK